MGDSSGYTGSWSRPAEDVGGLSPAERHLMEVGKREHRETTAAAQRAAKVAEETVDIGKNTLVELHRQGEQLDHVERHFSHLEEDVREADAIVKFMQRWCCIQLCCCCLNLDPEKQKGVKPRHQRMQVRNEQSLYEREETAERHMSKAAAVNRIAAGEEFAEPDAERSELFKTAMAIKKDRATTPLGFGNFPGMADKDRMEMDDETVKQEALLDQIGRAVEGMRAIGEDMNMELQAQDAQIDQLPQRAVKIHDDLSSLTKNVRKINS